MSELIQLQELLEAAMQDHRVLLAGVGHIYPEEQRTGTLGWVVESPKGAELLERGPHSVLLYRKETLLELRQGRVLLFDPNCDVIWTGWSIKDARRMLARDFLSEERISYLRLALGSSRDWETKQVIEQAERAAAGLELLDWLEETFQMVKQNLPRPHLA